MFLECDRAAQEPTFRRTGSRATTYHRCSWTVRAGARGAFNQSEEFKYEAAIRGDRFDVFEWWDLGASLRRHDVVLVRSERVDSVGNVRCIYEMKLASGEVLTRVQMQLHLCTWLPKLE